MSRSFVLVRDDIDKIRREYVDSILRVNPSTSIEPVTHVPSRMDRSGTSGLPVEHVHALRVAQLPLHHHDPFDRLPVFWVDTTVSHLSEVAAP
jgi:PIN domain nuclease of toxin-antitoxin system